MMSTKKKRWFEDIDHKIWGEDVDHTNNNVNNIKWTIPSPDIVNNNVNQIEKLEKLLKDKSKQSKVQNNGSIAAALEDYNDKVERRRMERMATFDDDEYDSDTIEEEKGEVESLIKVQEERSDDNVNIGIRISTYCCCMDNILYIKRYILYTVFPTIRRQIESLM